MQIQSHVTTVHKARSTSFDDTLAGPISEQDMIQMEKMINTCFPEITVVGSHGKIIIIKENSEVGDYRSSFGEVISIW